MAIRLLPFRDYDEHDVINLFALSNADVNEKLNDTGKGDAGAIVTATAGDLDASPVEYKADTANYMMGSHTVPHLGSNGYPEVPLKIDAATKGDLLLGLALRQTAKFDENGENLLRYPVKKDEYHAVSPGQAVPVATKGIFMLDSRSIAAKGQTVGKTLGVNTVASPTVVTVTGHGLASNDTVVIEGSNSVPSIDGTHVITKTGNDAFTIPVTVTTAGTAVGGTATIGAKTVADDATAPALGDLAALSLDADGRLMFGGSLSASVVGKVLGAGSRAAQGPSDVDVHAGKFYLLKLEL